MKVTHRNAGIAPMVLAAIVVVAGAWTGIAAAGAAAGTMEAEPVTLVGCLSPSGADESVPGQFTLIEQESGDWIPVTGSEELADHLGKTVEVTGSWQHDEANRRFFAAESITVVADSCEEQA